MRQYNEKPSKHSNIGQDILGASRHHRDTFENPEAEKQKREKKESDKKLLNFKKESSELFKIALSESTEKALEFLKNYEKSKALLSLGIDTSLELSAIKALYYSESDSKKREIFRKTYNKTLRVISKIRYIRPIELSKYFDTKKSNSFQEVNGHKGNWKQQKSSLEVEEAKNYLSKNTRGVQFGNSIPDIEREYCLVELHKTLKDLSNILNFSWNDLGFSFGSRGKAGSVAHYQDSKKVIAINRHWEGALIHELGHAIDYRLGCVSSKIPYSMVSRYRDKIEQNEFLKSKSKYYLKRTEIFARLLEGWAQENASNLSDFALEKTKSLCIPDLGQEELEFFESVFKDHLILKKAA